jgi:hypothetical protein
MSTGEVVRRFDWKMKAEHVNGRERQNMLVGETGRTCHWEIM